MESIGNVLKKISIPRATSGVSTGTSTADDACPICMGAGYLRLDVPVDDPRFGTLMPCRCTVQQQSERRMRLLLERSNLGPLRYKTFDNFVLDPERQRNPSKYDPEMAYRRARAFAERPERSEDDLLQHPQIEWLVLMGTHGTGKTHLAAAVANYRLDAGRPAIFVVVPDLLDRLRATFGPTSDVTYDELFESARTAPTLILDDLGAHSSTAWAQEKLYQLINERYNRRLPTVITTNLTLDMMDARLRSRIGDDHLTSVCVIDAEDVRTGQRTPASAPEAARPPSPRNARARGQHDP